VTKAANQIVCSGTIAAVGEALVFAKKAGVDPVRVREALLVALRRAVFLKRMAIECCSATFQPGFKLKLHRKDMSIVLNTARELGSLCRFLLS